MTSHDVVIAARRLLGERRIGHTGTLDPLATGVLPLVCGRATRLARFLASSDKTYQAGIRFGLATDSYDIAGTIVSATGRTPTAEAVAAALQSLVGCYEQLPPVYSAKKVGGRRAYALARGSWDVTLAPVSVIVARAELLALTGRTASIDITASAGFYVRTFADALGRLVGTGACLESLRRTRAGEFSLDAAVSIEELRTGGPSLVDRWLPLEGLLTWLPSTRLTTEGRRRTSHGQHIESSHRSEVVPGRPVAGVSGRDITREWVRLLDDNGRLVALGRIDEASGILQPAVVLT